MRRLRGLGLFYLTAGVVAACMSGSATRIDVAPATDAGRLLADAAVGADAQSAADAASSACFASTSRVSLTVPQCEGIRVRQASTGGIGIEVRFTLPECPPQDSGLFPEAGLPPWPPISLTVRGLPAGVSVSTWSHHLFCDVRPEPAALYFEVGADAAVGTTAIAIDAVDSDGNTATVVQSLTVLPFGPGSLDPTFGDHGVVRGVADDPPSGLPPLCPRSPLLVTPDGKIIAGGHFVGAPAGACLARFGDNGMLDPTFGNGGFLGVVPSAVALQPDGKLLVCAGNSLIRFDSAGIIDPSFGQAGSVMIADPPCAGLAVDASGRILVERDDGEAYDILDFRSGTTGALDTATADGGSLEGAGFPCAPFIGFPPHTPYCFSHAFPATVPEPDGEIVTFDGRIGRLNADGTPDESFGATDGGPWPIGQVPGGQAYFSGIAVQGTDVIALGEDGDGFLMRRLKGASGQVDATFGIDGTARSVAPLFGREMRAPVVTENGRILVLGWAVQRGPAVFDNDDDGEIDGLTLMRRNADGSLDPTFGADGWIPVRGAATDAYEFPMGRVALQPDGKILVLSGRDRGVPPAGSYGEDTALRRLMP
jgi:uncharacterized delta-60 repeat protein